MTPHEWRGIQTRVESLWGTSPKWKEAASLTDRVARVKHETATAVVDDLIMEKHCPPPALVIGMCLARAGTNPVTRPGPEDCDHPAFAIVEYRADQTRLGLCRVCHMEQLFQPGRLLMIFEIEAMRHSSQQPSVY